MSNAEFYEKLATPRSSRPPPSPRPGRSSRPTSRSTPTTTSWCSRSRASSAAPTTRRVHGGGDGRQTGGGRGHEERGDGVGPHPARGDARHGRGRGVRGRQEGGRGGHRALQDATSPSGRWSTWRRAGASGAPSASLGTALDVRPVLSCRDGEVVPHKRARGRKRQMAALLEEAKPAAEAGRPAVLRAHRAPELARRARTRSSGWRASSSQR